MSLNNNLISSDAPAVTGHAGVLVARRSIAILSTSISWGGLEMNILKLAHWLLKDGQFIVVICREESELARKCAEKGIKVVPLPYRRKYFDLNAARHLAQICHEQKVPNLIINSSGDLALTAVAKSFYHKTINVVFFLNMQFSKKKKDMWHTWEYSKVNAFVTPLSGLANSLENFTNIRKEFINVIPYGIEIARFKKVRNRQKECRAALGLPERAFLTGVIGRLDKLKGQEYLIRAAAMLVHAGIQVHVVIVGEPTRHEKNDYHVYLKELVNELDVADFVHFRPFMDNIEIAFGALDCFALTSHSETYGMVTLEAMAAALPVIGTNLGGTPELISDGITGWLVPYADAQALGEKMRMLYHDKDKRREAGKAAAEVAEKYFSHSRQTQSVIQLMK